MIRILLRFAVYFLLFLLLRSFLRNLFGGSRAQVPRSRTPQPPPVPAGGELKKDPVCGTYVSTATSFTKTVHGEVLYFCSKECLDRYGKAKHYGDPKTGS